MHLHMKSTRLIVTIIVTIPVDVARYLRPKITDDVRQKSHSRNSLQS